MKNKIALNNRPDIWCISGWTFGGIVIVIGILNILLVHPVPGIGYLLLSCLYLPPLNALVTNKLHFVIPILVKIVIGISITMFTLGVSDLGDMIDKL